MLANIDAKPGLLTALKTLVLDEADMLLAGNYERFSRQVLKEARKAAYEAKRPLQVTTLLTLVTLVTLVTLNIVNTHTGQITLITLMTLMTLITL